MSSPGILDALATQTLNFLYPTGCPVCREPRPRALATWPICGSCWGGILPYDGPQCSVCGRPFASGHATTCGDCLGEPPEFAAARSYGIYAEGLREAIHMLKFDGVRRLARPLGGLLASLQPPSAHMAVPVPITARALRSRGYNQSALLARELARVCGMPLRLDALWKVKETPPQVGLTRSARMRNLRGAFKADARLKGMDVVLVDDVITTTATARECSRALMKAGARSVFVASLARTY